MKRVLLLSQHIGSGYLTKGQVYDVQRIDFYIYNQELEESESFDYDTITENQKEQGHREIYIIDDRGHREIYIIDDRGQEEELDEYNDDKYILFEHDRDLAHYLIDNVEGLDLTLINMKKLLG
jgi:hypothetical protein